MDEKINRIRKWSEGGEANPYTLELNVTNRCNLNCRFCWQRGFEPNLNEEISDKKLLEILVEAKSLDIREVRIPGSGEPLVRKDITLELMEKIKDNSMHGLLITNGTLFDENILEKMVQIDWDIFTVSVDGADAKTHDYLRDREGTFGKVKKMLSELNRLKDEYNSEKPKIRFNTVLTNRNYNQLSELIELIYSCGGEDIQLQPMTVFSDVGNECKLEGRREELNESIRKAKRLADKYNIYTNIETFIDNDIVERTNEMDKVMEEETQNKNDFISVPCFEPWYNMVILPTGKVAQCSMFGGKGGDQIKGKTLEEVWFGDYFEKTRRRLLNHNLFSYCENCCVPVNLENKRIRRELKKVV
ncbi:MAG: radical SAM/SPASM domain-containing protein [Candidatus Aenigmatarchaeota archaeon]